MFRLPNVHPSCEVLTIVKFKRITFIFKEPLNKVIHYQGQDVTQEDILYTDVEGIRAKVKKELEKVIRSINMVRIINPAMFDLLKFHVMKMERTFDRMINFEKINETTYEFIYPLDMNALVQVKGFASKLGPLKKFALDRLKNEDLELVTVLREKELINAFERFSFVEMKLEQGSWKITTDEFESDLSGSLAQEGGLPEQKC